MGSWLDCGTQIARLRSENARLLRLLDLTPSQARPPGPTQTGIFDGPPAMVDVSSSPGAKVAFFASLFAARTDVYALRWENARTGRSGWMPAVRGGWRKGVAAGSREYLPLTADILASHLSGDIDVGLYQHLGIKPGQLGGGRTKTLGVIDIAMLQTLTRRDNIAELTARYGLVIVDECHHIPAAAFEHAVKQIEARRWLSPPGQEHRRGPRLPRHRHRRARRVPCQARDRIHQPGLPRPSQHE